MKRKYIDFCDTKRDTTSLEKIDVSNTVAGRTRRQRSMKHEFYVERPLERSPVFPDCLRTRGDKILWLEFLVRQRSHVDSNPEIKAALRRWQDSSFRTRLDPSRCAFTGAPTFEKPLILFHGTTPDFIYDEKRPFPVSWRESRAFWCFQKGKMLRIDVLAHCPMLMVNEIFGLKHERELLLPPGGVLEIKGEYDAAFRGLCFTLVLAKLKF